jgi:hypothetical protein
VSTIASTVDSAITSARKDVFTCPDGSVSLYQDANGAIHVYAEIDPNPGDWATMMKMVASLTGDRSYTTTEPYEPGVNVFLLTPAV